VANLPPLKLQKNGDTIMAGLILELVLMLIIILIAAELFTNALEHLGERLKISEGVTGSIFAAVGTALPETVIPVLALLAGTSNINTNEEIGVGSILGAPLMLSTLSLFLMAMSVLSSRGIIGNMHPEQSGLARDLNFFLFAFIFAALAMYVPHDSEYIRAAISSILVLTYFIYIMLTIRSSKGLVDKGHGTAVEGIMFLARFKLPTNLFTILLQLGVTLLLLIFGAKGFIAGVEGVAHFLEISTLLLSLLIVPIATELPEKVNSIIWIRRGKDTLAFGNITGAMVFQGTLLPAIGIMLTPWQPRLEVVSGVLVTLVAAAWIRISIREKGIPIWVLLVNGCLYAGNLAVVLTR
jgi:cation:H+ antiporter